MRVAVLLAACFAFLATMTMLFAPIGVQAEGEGGPQARMERRRPHQYRQGPSTRPNNWRTDGRKNKAARDSRNAQQREHAENSAHVEKRGPETRFRALCAALDRSLRAQVGQVSAFPRLFSPSLTPILMLTLRSTLENICHCR
jgi:hypothetical protein